MQITFLGNFSSPHCTEVAHAATLEHLGHTVTKLQEGQARAEDILHQAQQSDLLVWVKTHGWKTPGRITMREVLQRLRRNNIPTLAYHLDLYMGLPKRWKQYRGDEYFTVEHFVTVDKLMATWLNNNTNTHGIWLPPAVFAPDCTPTQPHDTFDITFVGSGHYHQEWPHRRMLIEHLNRRYGSRFRHYGSGSRHGQIRGQALNQVYADAKIVVGDSLCPGFNYQGHYWSDRIPETLGRNGFLLMPEVPGMADWYTDRQHLAYWPYGEFAALDKLIAHYLDNEPERQQIRQNGRDLVMRRDTFAHRWTTILKDELCL